MIKKALRAAGTAEASKKSTEISLNQKATIKDKQQ